MKRLRLASAVVIVAVFSLATSLLATPNYDRQNSRQDQFFLRTADIDQVVADYNVTVIGHWSSPSGDIYLVAAPPNRSPSAILAEMESDADVEDAEEVHLAGLPALNLASRSPAAASIADHSGTVSSYCYDNYMPNAWSGLTAQSAMALLQTAEAQRFGCGTGVVVAIIDTAIDVTHPHLADAVVPGYDFLRERPDLDPAVHEAGLNIRTLAIVESSETALLAGHGAHPVELANSVMLLDQTDSALETDLQELPQYYGHGTMTAGLIRAVAPGAKIMPLVAFDDHGQGHPYDIVRAVYHAVNNGAHVINMSFSMEDFSIELGLALEFARANGVIPVAAVGNRGELASVFPAAFSSTIGVASTNGSDHLTEFSNYGIYTADLAAPGNELVTLFPNGGYAVGWGTSFSTPLVAGTVALIRPMHKGFNHQTHKFTRLDLLYGAIYRSYLWDYVLSGGRLNSFGAVLYSM